MFLTNKYKSWYYIIISNAKTQERNKKNNYFESHHIIPKSFGGKKTKENLVLLTAREHYICHLLLVKMTEGKNKVKMAYALVRMRHNNGKHKRYNSRLFEYHRKMISHALKNSPKPIGHQKGEKNSMYGKKHSRESIRQMSETKKEKLANPENRKKMIDYNPRSSTFIADDVLYRSINDKVRLTGETKRHIIAKLKAGIYTKISPSMSTNRLRIFSITSAGTL